MEVDPPGQLASPLPATTHEDKVSTLVDRWLRLPLAKRPTALFAPSDRTAVQLYGAVRECGVRAGAHVVRGRIGVHEEGKFSTVRACTCARPPTEARRSPFGRTLIREV